MNEPNAITRRRVLGGLGAGLAAMVAPGVFAAKKDEPTATASQDLASQERDPTLTSPAMTKHQPTTLGAFSVSLAVKDIKASRAFYEKLGFEPAGGDPAQNWLILRNGTVTIGLFQGMFENNILTFNPGWDAKAQPVSEFTDVREHQHRLKKQGLTLLTEADDRSTGPASFTVADPDGNTILVDQHV